MCRGPRGWRVGAVFVAVFLLSASVASAASITVTTTSDAGSGTGDCATTDHACSLRQAITSADATSADIITLPPGLYRLTQSGPLQVSSRMTLLGAGARVTTIDQAQTGFGVIVVTSAGRIALNGVTVSGGNDSGGGGISSQGFVLINRSAITNNEADGYVICFVNCPPPTPEPGVGGGIYNSGQLTINDSTVAANVASAGTQGGSGADGGGIYSTGQLTIVNSTVAHNFAEGGSGAGYGGGIFMQGPAQLSLANATVAFNQATGTPAVGGNLYLYGVMHPVSSGVENSVIADGTAGAGSQNCGGGSLTSAGYNVTDNHQCGLTGATDAHVANARLSPLANHGGVTDTVALLPGSPAINRGDPKGCTDFGDFAITLDQRDVHRPQGIRCDSGAFEFRLARVTGRPHISGTPRVGDTLTCQGPLVQRSPDGPVTVAASWLRGAVSVGAGRKHRVTSADAGHTLRCRVTAGDAAGTVSRISPSVSVPGRRG